MDGPLVTIPIFLLGRSEIKVEVLAYRLRKGRNQLHQDDTTLELG